MKFYSTFLGKLDVVSSGSGIFLVLLSSSSAARGMIKFNILQKELDRVSLFTCGKAALQH